MAGIKTENMSNGNLMLMLVLVSLLVVGVAGLLGKTLATTIIRDTKVAKAKLAADKALTTNLNNAPKLVDAYHDLGATSVLLSDALPSTSDFPSIIVTLENMSKDAGFALKSVTPAAAVAATDVTAGTPVKGTSETYDFTVNFVGSYDSLRKFYADVETSIRPMRVRGMQLSGSGSSLTGVIDLQTYFQGEAELPITTETIK